LNESRKNLAKIKVISETEVEVQIVTGKSGSFKLAYKLNEETVAAIDITINSL
jgi:hypothetical protein